MKQKVDQKQNTTEHKSGKKPQDLFVKHFPQNAL